MKETMLTYCPKKISKILDRATANVNQDVELSSPSTQRYAPDTPTSE